MILRFIVENITSFKDAVEFNTFPSSKSHNHDNHRVSCGHATALRMAAIYGANGAGKSNLIDTLDLLNVMVRNGSIQGLGLADVPFKFNDDSNSSDISGLALEFYYNGNVYYYHVEFSEEVIHLEELLLCNKNKDNTIFKREGDDITVKGKFFVQRTNARYLDTIKRMLRPDMLMLSFLGYYYPNESSYITEAYSWFVTKLRIVKPNYVSGFVPHLLDTNKQFSDLVNATIPELKTGIEKLIVKKEILKDDIINSYPSLQRVVKQAKDHPGEPQTYSDPFFNMCNIVFEPQTDAVYMKRLMSIHKRLDNSEVEMSMISESDGTRRLIEYMPLFYSVIQNGGVFVVDEIERSIHPIMIKNIIRILSESTNATGQLIFTTHESCLLDQNILRPDEIWFAQKDSEQATQLYPLSDFNIHHTANIENGYLNGRYGGIPFLSNLKDLHW